MSIRKPKGKEEKKMKKKFLAGMMVTGLMAMSLTGCGNSQTTAAPQANATTDNNAAADNNTSADNNAAADSNASEAGSEDKAEAEVKETTGENLSGTLTLAGSTSMEKLCEALSESFMEAYPDITVTVEYTGSGAGLESLTAGSVDIGNSSRHLKDSEVEKGAVENVVAIDGIAVIANKDNSVTNVSSEDLAKIYKGEVTNWSELGGTDEAIVVIGREAGSGTRDAFEELLEVSDACNYAQELDSTGAVLAKTASTPGAIGYVSLDVVDDTVIALSLDDVAPTEENILAGDYLLSRPFVMATNGELSAQSDLVKTWFEYINSEEGKNVISSIGLILPQ